MVHQTRDSKFYTDDGLHRGYYVDPETGHIIHEDGSRATGSSIEPAPDVATVHEAADLLHTFAEHFVPRDWTYTRDHDIRHIRYDGDFSGYDAPGRRLARAVRHLIPTFDGNLQRALREIDTERVKGEPFARIKAIKSGLLRRYYGAKIRLRTPDHNPDGVLDGGGVIVQWEETGEYIDLVQPQVGSLIADFLQAEPDNPHARKIAGAMLHFRGLLVAENYDPTDQDDEGTDHD